MSLDMLGCSENSLHCSVGHSPVYENHTEVQYGRSLREINDNDIVSNEMYYF